MRKTVEVLSLMVLGYLYWITWWALNGAERLPDRIPTHFDISGQPNAWGPPTTLWLLPAIGTGLYLLMTVLGNVKYRRYNLPVQVTEANLPFIQAQTSEIVAWIKSEVLCLFIYLQWSIIQSARSGSFRVSPLMIPLFLVVVFSTVGWRLVVMIRGARDRSAAVQGQDR
jgi:uncharacterized membrane protein